MMGFEVKLGLTEMGEFCRAAEEEMVGLDVSRSLSLSQLNLARWNGYRGMSLRAV